MTIKSLLFTIALGSAFISINSSAHEGGLVVGIAQFYQEVAKQCMQKTEYSQNQSN